MKRLLFTMMVAFTFLFSGCVGPAKKDSASALKASMAGKKYGKPYDAKKDYLKHQAKLCSQDPHRKPSFKSGKPRAVAATCTQYSSIIYSSGQALNTGSVSVSNDETYLYLDLFPDTGAGWGYTEAHIFVGPMAVPVTGTGAPDISQFIINDSYFSPQGAFRYTFALSDLMVACGQKLNFAIQMLMKRTDAGGNVLQEEVAWVFGPNTFAGDPSAWWFEYTPCCPNSDNSGCTATVGFWKNYNAFAKGTKKDPWPIPETTQLCGKSWLDILKMSPPRGDAWVPLAQQWIAAKLNIAEGASSGTAVDAAIASSETLLSGNCRSIPKSLKSDALAYSSILESYNSGFTGPGHCE